MLTSAFIASVQKALIRHGYKLIVTGIIDAVTSKALIDFKKKRGLKARDYIGPVTQSLLFRKGFKRVRLDRSLPKWMQVAKTYIGTKEIPGKRHNSKILNMWKRLHINWVETDEVPWCASFVGSVLEQTGLKSTRSGLARSYLNWGEPIDEPAVGAVVVYWRGSKEGRLGHVGFVNGVDKKGRILTLGGNQADAVNVKAYPPDRVLGYRWPTSAWKNS